jgi:hypothetical protein
MPGHSRIEMMNWLWKRNKKRRHLDRVRFDRLKIGDIIRLKGEYWKVVMFSGPNKPILGKVERP